MSTDDFLAPTGRPIFDFLTEEEIDLFARGPVCIRCGQRHPNAIADETSEDMSDYVVIVGLMFAWTGIRELIITDTVPPDLQRFLDSSLDEFDLANPENLCMEEFGAEFTQESLVFLNAEDAKILATKMRALNLGHVLPMDIRCTIGDLRDTIGSYSPGGRMASYAQENSLPANHSISLFPLERARIALGYLCTPGD